LSAACTFECVDVLPAIPDSVAPIVLRPEAFPNAAAICRGVFALSNVSGGLRPKNGILVGDF
jgi:hypothetical protein